MRKSNKLKWPVGLIAGSAIFVTSVLLSQIVPVSYAQFVDRIVRPCPGGSARGTVQVTTTDILVNPCPGGSVTINGVPIVAGGGGDVFGPASSTDNAAARFNLLTGKLIQNSLLIIADNGDVTTPGSVTVGNAGGVNGAIDLSGLTSGTVTLTVLPVAGTWTLTLPVDDGTAGQFLQTNGSGVTSWQTVTPGTGDVVGPGSATDNAIARFDSTTGKLIQNSLVTIDDTGALFATMAASANAFYITGTNGSGVVFFPAQSAANITTSAGYALFSDASNRAVWACQGCPANTIFDFSLITTSDKVFQWPDQSGTVALLSDIPAAGVTCAGCTANALSKTTGAGTLGDSTLNDSGTLLSTVTPLAIGLAPAQSGPLRIDEDAYLTSRNVPNTTDVQLIGYDQNGTTGIGPSVKISDINSPIAFPVSVTMTTLDARLSTAGVFNTNAEHIHMGYNNLELDPTPATSGSTSESPGRLSFVNSYWDGAAAQFEELDVTFELPVPGTPKSLTKFTFYDFTFGTPVVLNLSRTLEFYPDVTNTGSLGISGNIWNAIFANNANLAGELTIAKTIRTGTASNTDVAGSLTVGAGGTITYTFTQTYASAPICVSSDTDAVPLITGASTSTTVLTVTGNAGHVVNYLCVGRN